MTYRTKLMKLFPNTAVVMVVLSFKASDRSSSFTILHKQRLETYISSVLGEVFS